MEVNCEMKAMTPEEIRAVYEPVIEIKHPMISDITLRLRIRRGLSPKMLLLSGVPIPNPLAPLVVDEKDTEEAATDAEGKEQEKPPEITLHEGMKRIAEIALKEPTYDKIKDIIEDDLFILSKITAVATGLDLFSNLFDANNPFRGGGQGDVTPELVTPGISG